MALADNIVAYYKFQGNSNDSVNTANGTDTSMAYGTSYGKIDKGARFDGSNSYITFTLAQPTSAYSLNFWIKHDSVSNDANRGIWDSQNPGNTSTGVSFCYNANLDGSNTKRLRAYHNNGSWSQTDDLGTTLEGSSMVMVTLTWDGSRLKFYTNASLVKDNAYSTAITNWGTVRVGNRTTSNQYLGANVDEYGVWSRALSSTEITTLYNSGNGLQYPFVTTNIKTIVGLDFASVKTFNGLAKASIKSINGLT